MGPAAAGYPARRGRRFGGPRGHRKAAATLRLLHQQALEDIEAADQGGALGSDVLVRPVAIRPQGQGLVRLTAVPAAEAVADGRQLARRTVDVQAEAVVAVGV